MIGTININNFRKERLQTTITSIPYRWIRSHFGLSLSLYLAEEVAVGPCHSRIVPSSWHKAWPKVSRFAGHSRILFRLVLGLAEGVAIGPAFRLCKCQLVSQWDRICRGLNKTPLNKLWFVPATFGSLFTLAQDLAEGVAVGPAEGQTVGATIWSHVGLGKGLL